MHKVRFNYRPKFATVETKKVVEGCRAALLEQIECSEDELDAALIGSKAAFCEYGKLLEKQGVELIVTGPNEGPNFG